MSKSCLASQRQQTTSGTNTTWSIGLGLNADLSALILNGSQSVSIVTVQSRVTGLCATECAINRDYTQDSRNAAQHTFRAVTAPFLYIVQPTRFGLPNSPASSCTSTKPHSRRSWRRQQCSPRSLYGSTCGGEYSGNFSLF